MPSLGATRKHLPTAGLSRALDSLLRGALQSAGRQDRGDERGQAGPGALRCLRRYDAAADQGHEVQGRIHHGRLRGWELPDRARHRASSGDIFVGAVWSSVSKWFIAGGHCDALLVSNGFIRLRAKPGYEAHRVDIVAGLVSESYLIQARALCTGSDGLAELAGSDSEDIVLPRVTDPSDREALQGTVDALLKGRATVSNIVMELQSAGQVPPNHPTPDRDDTSSTRLP